MGRPFELIQNGRGIRPDDAVATGSAEAGGIKVLIPAPCRKARGKMRKIRRQLLLIAPTTAGIVVIDGNHKIADGTIVLSAMSPHARFCMGFKFMKSFIDGVLMSLKKPTVSSYCSHN
jgi:hypothetical protein